MHIVEPGVGISHEFLLTNIGWVELLQVRTAGTSFDPLIDSSIGQPSRGISSGGAELVARGVCFDQEFGSSLSTMLEIAYFLHIFFLCDLYFPSLLEKRIEQLSPPEPEPTLSMCTTEP